MFEKKFEIVSGTDSADVTKRMEKIVERQQALGFILINVLYSVCNTDVYMPPVLYSALMIFQPISALA